MLLRYLFCSLGLFPALQSAAQSVDVGHSFDLAQILDAELGADGSQTLDALRSTHESADLVAGGNELAAHANELAVEPLSFFKPADSAAVLASDPFEPVNRLVFRFNEQLDRRLIRPVARVYLQTLPGPLRDGFSNMLLNLDDLVSFLNQLLQAKPSKAAVSLARFIFNSSFGIVGFFLTLPQKRAFIMRARTSAKPLLFGVCRAVPMWSCHCLGHRHFVMHRLEYFFSPLRRLGK